MSNNKKCEVQEVAGTLASFAEKLHSLWTFGDDATSALVYAAPAAVAAPSATCVGVARVSFNDVVQAIDGSPLAAADLQPALLGGGAPAFTLEAEAVGVASSSFVLHMSPAALGGAVLVDADGAAGRGAVVRDCVFHDGFCTTDLSLQPWPGTKDCKRKNTKHPHQTLFQRTDFPCRGCQLIPERILVRVDVCISLSPSGILDVNPHASLTRLISSFDDTSDFQSILSRCRRSRFAL